MAGIGFELRKLLKKNTLVGLLEAYSYAAVIGSGPWVLSIVGILIIGLMSVSVVVPAFMVTQFQVSLTYLIAGSLIYTGLVQLAFTRFISDRLFEKRHDLVMSNLNGLLTVTVTSSAALGTVLVFLLFPGLSVLYRLLMLAAFVLLCGIWVCAIFMSGLKRYKAIVVLFAAGYAITVLAALVLRPFGLEGLLAGFVAGQFVLFSGMWLVTGREFAPDRLISFEFAEWKTMYPSLMAIGILYYLGIWADKFMFWYHPDTSDAIIGALRASVIYDLPVYLAYLSIIPGMAVFLVRIETDFVEFYDRYYDAVREGGSLEYIENMRDEMVYSIRQGLAEIAKIQTLAILITFVAGPAILDALGISQLYLPLLHIQVIGAGLQVVFLSVLNVFFYLDQRRTVLGLVVLFLVLNVVLTALTLRAGAAFYGYGFTIAILITLVVSLALLDRKLGRLEYDTFMLQ
jgi:uncharacterized membrane protein